MSISNDHSSKDSHSSKDGDSRIYQGILDYLAGFQMRPLNRIRVAVHSGTVMLHGEVHSFYQKQLLLGCRSHVPGIGDLIDHVQVVDGPQVAPA